MRPDAATASSAPCPPFCAAAAAGAVKRVLIGPGECGRGIAATPPPPKAISNHPQRILRSSQLLADVTSTQFNIPEKRPRVLLLPTTTLLSARTREIYLRG